MWREKARDRDGERERDRQYCGADRQRRRQGQRPTEIEILRDRKTDRHINREKQISLCISEFPCHHTLLDDLTAQWDLCPFRWCAVPVPEHDMTQTAAYLSLVHGGHRTMAWWHKREALFLSNPQKASSGTGHMSICIRWMEYLVLKGTSRNIVLRGMRKTYARLSY